MRLIAYAVSAACGCGGAAYPVMQAYDYPTAIYSTCDYNPCGGSSWGPAWWGGDTPYRVLDTGPQYIVGSRHTGVMVARHNAATVQVAAVHHKRTMLAKAKATVKTAAVKTKHYVRQVMLIE